jgi:5'-nucleotidase
VLGTGPIDPTIVDTLDEQGRATVTFTIPDGVFGSQTLTVSGPGGTAVSVPIEIAEPAVPIKTTSYGSVDRLISFGGRNVDYKMRVVAADGSEPVGEVTIYDGRRVLTTTTLEIGDDGRLEVRLPRLSRGIHFISAVFEGDGFVDSRTWPSLVLVL